MANSEKDISIEELKKATQSLKIAQSLLADSLKNNPEHFEMHKALRDSCIQRFQFCVELSWKVSIKIIGLSTKSPNVAIRDMAQNNLIDSPDKWFDFLTARNKTSHTYNENIAQQVYNETLKLIPELDQLLRRLEQF